MARADPELHKKERSPESGLALPEEVEVCVKQHPDVIDCLVVGVDDADFGQRVTAVASTRAGSETDEAALREFVRVKIIEAAPA